MLNLEDIISQKEFEKLRQRKVIIGECFNTKVGIYDLSHFDSIKISNKSSNIQVAFSKKLQNEKGNKIGKYIGYLKTKDNKYIRVKQKATKERVAVELVDYLESHPQSKQINMDTLKQLIQQTDADALNAETSSPLKDINVRNHLNFTDFRTLPLEYKEYGYIPYVIQNNDIITMVDIHDFYVSIENAKQFCNIEYWIPECNQRRTDQFNFNIQHADYTELLAFSYAKNAGQCKAVYFPNIMNGKTGKGAIKKQDKQLLKLNTKWGKEEVKYYISYEADEVLESDELQYSVTTELKKNSRSHLYVPQIFNSSLALDCNPSNKKNPLNHTIGSLFLFDKKENAFYYFFFQFQNLHEITAPKLIGAIAFTTNLHYATSFHYYSKEGEKLYDEKQPSFLKSLLMKAS